ncbi:MAG: 23S rRNA (uracil(1939)-C(5))-methyltransferase RlmD [Candidatus Eremiobacteraeota bacterium]|nr:23S rRNA (uracil(1939)-C(5))-methyltransferase RlmD [Candidatus Eremiobacteraeota bacterium]
MTIAAADSAAARLSRDPITLDDLLENGQGVGRADGLVVFVSGGLPGEHVRIAVDAVKRNYASAHVTSIEQASPARVAPICPVFGRCGGCQVMHLAYDAQLEWKRRMVGDALQRLGGIADVAVDETVASPVEQGTRYRNKAGLVTRFAEGRMRLGFYEARSHRVVPIESCPVLLPRLDDAVKALIAMAQESPQPFSPARHVVARASATGPGLVIAFNGPKPNKAAGAYVDEIRRRIPEVTGVVTSWDLENENALFGARSATLWGSPMLQESVAGAVLRFGIESFFQINTAVLELIATRVISEFAGMRRVVDLYCGVATFAVILGKRGIAGTGIEWFKPAADECAANAAANGVVNVAFEHADAVEAVSGERGRTLLAGADGAILDPPRKGCEPAVLEALAGSAVSRIVYISCNPATLARDAKLLVARGYRLASVTPYDMFPQTGHVEVLATFVRT